MNKTPEEMAEKWCAEHTCHLQMTCHANAFLAGYAAAQPKWISVKERLPKVLESVLVVYAPTNEAKNDHRMECWNWPETEVYEKKFITHWMPLPEPPKENE